MERTYEMIKSTLEGQIRLLAKRGDDITPEEMMSLKNALSSIEKIHHIMELEGMKKE